MAFTLSPGSFGAHDEVVEGPPRQPQRRRNP
jgi:hypothetical protein